MGLFIQALGLKNILFAVLLAGLLGAVGVQSYRLHACTAELTDAQGVVASLNAQIALQNAGIEAVRAATERTAKASARANAAAAVIGSKAEYQALAIEQAPAPATCQDAINFLVDEASK